MSTDKPATAGTAEAAAEGQYRLACATCYGSFFSPVWRMRCPVCVEDCARMMYRSLPESDYAE